jgi:hypothetical protein
VLSNPTLICLTKEIIHTKTILEKQIIDIKEEIIEALSGISVEWVNPNSNDGENGITQITVKTPNALITLD